MQVDLNKLNKVIETVKLTDEERFMTMAVTVSAESPDPSSQVGSCFVDDNGNVLSTGYNHIPRQWTGVFPWERNGSFEKTKYAYIIHSEVDGLHNYKGNNDDLVGSTLYVTLFPCNNCARQVVLSGIKKVVYLVDKYKYNKDGTPNSDNVAAKELFERCGVEVVDFNTIKTEKFAKVEECYDEEIREYVKMLAYIPKNN